MTVETHAQLHSRPLGTPLPDCAHACSVSLPTWQDVIDYEEGRPETLALLETGYPRFLIHPIVRQLFKSCAGRFAGADEASFAFPSRASAQRCVAFLERQSEYTGRIDDVGYAGLHAVTFPATCAATVQKYWQHSGEIVSSRLAQGALDGGVPAEAPEAERSLARRIASFSSAPEENVLLYPSGMAAIFHAHRFLREVFPGRATAQIGFAYLDTVKIQEWFGEGIHSFPHGREADFGELESLAKAGRLAGAFAEFPTNPLLDSVDLERIHGILSKHGVPLVVDDTIGTFLNVDPFPHADFVATSLTKSFSGTGDVMSGSLVLSPHSAFAAKHAGLLRSMHDVRLSAADAEALDGNSRGFVERQRAMNANAERLAGFLAAHPAVETVYYPKYRSTDPFRKLMREGGGWGALLSIVLRDAPRNSPAFYDALDVPKGPSLGTNFTLVCPYTMIAHYRELEWAEAQGVSRWLVRVSAGTEPYDLIEARFAAALDALA